MSVGESSALRALLAPLAEDGYLQFDDRRLPGRESDLDHVLVGPAGTFVVETKSWGGHLSTDDDVLRNNGFRKTQAVNRARGRAAAVADVVNSHLSGPPRTVSPVFCFVGTAQVGIPGVVGGVHVVDGDKIVDMFRRLPPVLHAGEVGAIGSVVTDNLPSRRAEREPVADGGPGVGMELIQARRVDVAHPPVEPIVFLTAWQRYGQHRLIVKDELGNDGGHLDLKTGGVVESTEAATAVLVQLLSHYGNGPEASEPSGESRGAVRRFLSSVFSSSTPVGEEQPLVVGVLWRNYGLRRLDVHRLEPGGHKAELGWYDLDDGLAHAGDAESEAIVEYCGVQYLRTHPQTRRAAASADPDLLHRAG